MALTDAEWRLVQPLLPPQKQMTERPCHDHRTVLTGILWVVRSNASCRAMPQEYGTWETAYQRYRLWCASGPEDWRSGLRPDRSPPRGG